MDAVYLLPEVECTISFKKPSLEEFDEDEDKFFTKEISIILSGSKKAIQYHSPVKLYINNKFIPIEKMKDEDENISISSNSIGEQEAIFTFIVKNNELTKSLQQILDLIETSDHLGITDYNEFVNKFDDLLIENGLGYINSVHIEMITRVLIRDAETGERLDFSKEMLDDYRIIRVSNSIMEGPLAISLSFERLNDQLVNLETYEKNSISIMDNLFL